LIGTGGTGKSTYNDLLTMVIGENNTTTQSLEELEDKHNIIDLFGKRLLALPDQTPITTRKNSNFKRLTGGDDLSGRRLYRDTANFKFKGMTLLTSNRPFVFPASTANWLHRRMILIECNNVIPKHQRDGRLINRMEKELPALTNYLLSISDKELENTLKGIDEPDLTLASWEHHCQSDGLAAFINDEIINDPEAVTPIGSNKDRWKDDKYNPHQSALYDAYCHYCRKTGRTAKTTQTFSSDFLEIAENILGWQVSRDRKKFGGKQERVISGVRLRTELDSNYPTVEEMLEGDNGDNGGTTKGDNLTNAQSPDISSIPEKGEKGDNLNCKKSKLEPSTSDATYRGLNTKSSDQAVTPVTPKAETPDTTESERVTTQNKGDNYDSYPATRSDDSRHKEKRANKCKKQLLACQTKADLDKFKTESGFSENEYKWVWHNLLTGKEKARINAIANTDQLDLSQASNKSAPPKLEDLAIGDKVWVKSYQVSGEIKKIDLTASKYPLQIDHPYFLSWFSLSDLELLD
jgi:putative DNA primase/helicase